MRKAEITVDVVRCLLDEQVPDLRAEPVRPVEVDGWDNTSFRVGARWLARLPSDDGYVPAVAKEHRWLPALAPHLPVAIPEPVVLGAPGCGFPRPWSLYRWLPGGTATDGRVVDFDALARDLAGFLRALHDVDPTGGPVAGAHSFGRGGPLAFYDADVRGCVNRGDAEVDAVAVLRVWADAVQATFSVPGRWFHGDVTPSNLLVEDGRLSAVIDFGTCGVGDPACDLVMAWTCFDGPSQRIFRDGVALDDGTWARARGWALWKALLTLRDPDPDNSARRYGWRFPAAEIIRRIVADES